MTSARVLYGLLTAIIVTGVPASFDSAWDRLYVTAWVVAAALVALVTMANLVADEIRWHREVNAIINAPEDTEAGAIKELAAVAATAELVAE